MSVKCRPTDLLNSQMFFWITFILSATCLAPSVAHLSMYMDEAETTRLLGVPGDLYYCRNGVLNDYALSFNLLIKNEITEIYFKWQNEPPFGLQKPDIPMQYSMAVSVSNLHAMYQPVVSIPLNGSVPGKPSGFSITLLCTGLLSIDVDIRIQLNVSRASNIILLEIRRKKPCLRGLHQTRPKTTEGPWGVSSTMPTTLPDHVYDEIDINHSAEEDHLVPEMDEFSDELGEAYVAEDGEDRDLHKDEDHHVQTMDSDAQVHVKPSTTIVYVATGCGLGAVVVVAAVVVGAVCRMSPGKSARRRHKSDIIGTMTNKLPTGESSFLMSEESRDLPQTGSCSLISSGKLSFGSASPAESDGGCENSFDDMLSMLYAVRIEPCRLSITDLVTHGVSTYMSRGVLMPASEPCGRGEHVLVKAFKEHVRQSDEEFYRLTRDSVALIGLQHENLCPLVAACLDAGTLSRCDGDRRPCRPLRLVYLASANDLNLRLFLDHCRLTQAVLSVEQLTCLAIQLSTAVQYLHRQRVVHRDIATRNCLINSSCMSLRLTDGALSSDIFPQDYHTLGVSGMTGCTDCEILPVKWMAVESLDLPVGGRLRRPYSPATDVWSFGVTMWELLTLGLEPYCDVQAMNIALYLRHGHRLTIPYGCPRELYSAMSQCWLADPSERPTVAQLQTLLHNYCNSVARIK